MPIPASARVSEDLCNAPAQADAPESSHNTDELSPAGFEALRCAVNLARYHQIQGLPRLRVLLLDKGFSEVEVQEGITHWARYEAKKKAAAEAREQLDRTVEQESQARRRLRR